MCERIFTHKLSQKTHFWDNFEIFVHILFIQAASLACAVRLANATLSLGAALRAFQRITLRDCLRAPLLLINMYYL